MLVTDVGDKFHRFCHKHPRMNLLVLKVFDRNWFTDTALVVTPTVGVLPTLFKNFCSDDSWKNNWISMCYHWSPRTVSKNSNISLGPRLRLYICSGFPVTSMLFFNMESKVKSLFWTWAKHYRILPLWQGTTVN